MNIKTIKKNDRRFFYVYAVRYKIKRYSENDICWGLYYDEEEAKRDASFVLNTMYFEIVFIARQIVWVK